MAPRTRKAAAKAAPADTTPPTDVATSADVADTGEPVADVVVEVVETFTAPAPEAGVDYVADHDFTATVGAQLLTFTAGTVIDPLAGAYLAPTGAPVSTVPTKD